MAPARSIRTSAPGTPPTSPTASCMFLNATSFNQNISGWNTSHYRHELHVLERTAFNQNLSAHWNTSSVDQHGLQCFTAPPHSTATSLAGTHPAVTSMSGHVPKRYVIQPEHRQPGTSRMSPTRPACSMAPRRSIRTSPDGTLRSVYTTVIPCSTAPRLSIRTSAAGTPQASRI